MLGKPKPRLIAGLVAVFAVAVVGTVFVVNDGNADDNSTVVGAAADRFPSEDLSDWVTYADQVAVVSILEETLIDPPADVAERQEGYVERVVEMRVDSTLWTSSDAKARAEGTIDFEAFGWILKGEDIVPIAPGGGTRLEVGKRYVIPLVKIEKGWSSLSPSSIIGVNVDGELVLEERITNPATLALVESSANADELAAQILATSPDPDAEEFSHLPPEERYNAVAALKDARFFAEEGDPDAAHDRDDDGG